MAKIVCDKHGDVTYVSLIFLDTEDHKHPKEFKGKAICFYCLAEQFKLIDVKED